MKQIVYSVALVLIVGLLSACAKHEPSPLIVCVVDGKVVPTAFTFESFKQALAIEHGGVEVTGYEKLASRSLVVFFKPQADGTVLADRAVAVDSDQEMTPAVLFGLTSAPTITPPAQPQTADLWASNVPSASVVTN